MQWLTGFEDWQLEGLGDSCKSFEQLMIEHEEMLERNEITEEDYLNFKHQAGELPMAKTKTAVAKGICAATLITEQDRSVTIAVCNAGVNYLNLRAINLARTILRKRDRHNEESDGVERLNNVMAEADVMPLPEFQDKMPQSEEERLQSLMAVRNALEETGMALAQTVYEFPQTIEGSYTFLVNSNRAPDPSTLERLASRSGRTVEQLKALHMQRAGREHARLLEERAEVLDMLKDITASSMRELDEAWSAADRHNLVVKMVDGMKRESDRLWILAGDSFRRNASEMESKAYILDEACMQFDSAIRAHEAQYAVELTAAEEAGQTLLMPPKLQTAVKK